MLLSQQEIKDIFAKANAIITDDHFVYAKKETGWFHGSDYVNKDAIYPYTRLVSTLCKEIADNFWHVGPKIVIGPTVGAVILSQWTAHWLAPYEHQLEVLAVYADKDVFEMGEKVGPRRVIRRGYDKHVKGKKCLIVEDVINSGATVAKTRYAILEAGGEIIGVGALCNRSGGKVTAETLKVPELFSLINLDMKMFPEDECPICKERGPKSVRTDLGKGKDFLVRKGL